MFAVATDKEKLATSQPCGFSNIDLLRHNQMYCRMSQHVGSNATETGSL